MKKIENEFIFDIENKIYNIRNTPVMLDSDLAELYSVETKVINQAVKRNPDRFPTLFCFQLSDKEWKHLRSQIVTSSNNYLKFKIKVQGFNSSKTINQKTLNS